MRIWGAGMLLAAACAASCVQSNVVTCANGHVCPIGLLCNDVHGCVRPGELDACAGRNEGDACSDGIVSGVCQLGLCTEARCGDGIVTGAEDCEAGDTRGVTDCKQLGYYDSGPVGCTDRCTFDDGACARKCGDLELDLEEQCDQPGGERILDCRELGFYNAGDVTCSSCLYNTTACSGRCGDGVVNGEELCDGSPLLSTCLDFGYHRGHASCIASACAADISGCRRIGWSQVPGTLGAWGTAWSPGANELFLSGGSTTRNVLRIVNGQGTTTTLPGTGPSVSGLWGASGNDVHAVTFNGGIFRYTNGSWTQTSAPGALASGLSGIAGVSANEIFAVGASERILAFNGSMWTPVHSPTSTIVLNDVWVDSSGAGYAVGSGGKILRRNGTSWVAETSGTSTRLAAVWGSSATDVWAAGDAGTLLHRTATGWAPVTIPVATGDTITDLWGRSADDVYALVLGTNPGVFHYDGASWWRLVLGDYPGTARKLAGNTGDTFVLTDAVALRSEGASWTPLEDPIDGPFFQDVAAGADGTLAVLAECDVLVRGVSSWTNAQAQCSTPGNLFDWYDAVWVGATGEVFAVENNGAVSRFDGSVWTRDPAGSAGENVYGVGGSGPSDVWAVSYSPRAGTAHWNGATWTKFPISDGVQSVWSSSATNAYAVGWGIFQFSGTAWTEVTPSGWFGFLRDVWGSGPNDVWAVGNEGMIMHFDGNAWTQVASGTGVGFNAIAGTGPNDVWIAGGSGTLLHYDGVAWSPVQGPSGLDFHDVAVRDDLVLLAAWHNGLVALVRGVGW